MHTKLAKAEDYTSVVIRIGPAGWTYKDWAGIVYPHPRPRGFSPLQYLSQFFDTLEINTSFYGPPKAQTTQTWLEQVSGNSRFQFTAKLWRGFTHERNATPEDEKLIKDGMTPLVDASRFGALLMQFPISFQNTSENRQYIADLERRFRQFPLVLEVRHRSWADEAVLEFLSELAIGFCNIDQPLLGKALKPSARRTSPVGYVRLHGRNYQNWFAENKRSSDRYDYLYSMNELEPWADRVRSISEKRRESVFVVTNNHFEGKAAVNALQLAALLKDEPVKAPEQLVMRYPELRSIVETT
ncbi:MAG TPA: DUF72 domain-containing protein [Bryobacteraceae bacterium]|nr:DUF72 domain-containing protein [Bryobacteraceae bacterium]